jgi:hypothetical protein
MCICLPTGHSIFICYGSGWGTSPGLIYINDTPKKKVGARSISIYIFIWFESIDRLMGILDILLYNNNNFGAIAIV